jgi:hypothetical protein
MENHYVKNKKDIIKHSKNSLGLMTDLVESKYPSDERDTCSKLVAIINREFNTEFTEDDLIAYNALTIEIEDKLLIHKHITGYDHGDISQYGDINGE